MTFTEPEMREVFEALAEIRADVRTLKERHRDGRPECATHAAYIEDVRRRIAVLEAAAGKEKFATAVIGATAAAFVLLAKFLFESAR